MSVVGPTNPKCMNENDRNRKRKRSKKPIEVTEKTGHVPFIVK